MVLWQQENDQFVCLMDDGTQFAIAEDAFVGKASMVPLQKAVATEGHHAEQILRLKGIVCEKAYQRGKECGKTGTLAADNEFETADEKKAYKQGLEDGTAEHAKRSVDPTSTAGKLSPDEEGALNECLESARPIDMLANCGTLGGTDRLGRQSVDAVLPPGSAGSGDTITVASPVPEWGDLEIPITGRAVLTEISPDPQPGGSPTPATVAFYAADGSAVDPTQPPGDVPVNAAQVAPVQAEPGTDSQPT